MDAFDKESIWFSEPPPNKKLLMPVFAVFLGFFGWIEIVTFERSMVWELSVFFVFMSLSLGAFWWLLDQGGECGRKLIVDKHGIRKDIYYKGALQPNSSYKISWSNISLIQIGHSSRLASDSLGISEKHYGTSGVVIHIHTNEKVRLFAANEWFAEPSQSLAFIGIEDRINRRYVLSDVIKAFAECAQVQIK